MKAGICPLTINVSLPLCIGINNHLNVLNINMCTDVKTQPVISDMKWLLGSWVSPVHHIFHCVTLSL